MFKISLAILAILNLYTLSLFSADIETQIANAFGAKCIGLFQVIAVVGFILPLSLLLLKLLIFKPKQEKPGPDKTPGGKTSDAEQTEEYVHEETIILTIKKITKTIRKKIKDIFAGGWQVQGECFQNSAENEKVEEEYLSDSTMNDWSPVKVGQVANQKALDDFVNLLNLNPDRYISPVISRGAEPDTLALGYNIYEANPSHYFLQIDNSGTKDRQWPPRLGLINTNLLGIDDRFTVMHQAPCESDIDEDYSIYGSNDFPLTGSRLRLNLYAGYSQYVDINKVGRLSGTFRRIGANERLVPGKMTAFGGMYSVRGYNEYEWLGNQESIQTPDGSNGYGLYDMAGNVWEWCND